jgi:hypothetical protein
MSSVVISNVANTVCVCYWSFWGKNRRFFLRQSVKLLPLNSSLWILFGPKGNYKDRYCKSFWKMLQNDPFFRFGSWGVTEIFWLKIIRFCWKSNKSRGGGEMPDYFIVISILNLHKSSCNRCNGLSFLISQTRFVYFIYHFGAKTAHFFLRKSVNLIPINICLLNHQLALFAQEDNFKSMIFWKLKNILHWVLFVALLGVTEIFWGKIIRFCWKITINWGKKMYNHFIIISILNPKESFYNKCHRLSLQMFQTQFVYCIGDFGAKWAIQNSGKPWNVKFCGILVLHKLSKCDQ